MHAKMHLYAQRYECNCDMNNLQYLFSFVKGEVEDEGEEEEQNC